jgi:hypothetical protein
MLDDLELQSVQLALEPLVLGRLLGSGQNTATFELKSVDDMVVKVFRRHAARHLARSQAAGGFAPRVLGHKAVGLLDVLLVERVKPFKLSSVGGGTCLHESGLHQGGLHEEQCLDMLVRLPKDFGLVHFGADDPRTLGLGERGPVLLDSAACLRLEMSEQEQTEAGALHCGLVCKGQGLGPESPLFQHFASVAVTGKPRPHAGLRFSRADLAGLKASGSRLGAQLVSVASDLA